MTTHVSGWAKRDAPVSPEAWSWQTHRRDQPPRAMLRCRPLAGAFIEESSGTARANRGSMRNTKHCLPKKTAFVPRFAYGCVGIGMSVVPVCASCTEDVRDAVPPPTVYPAVFDGSAADAPNNDAPPPVVFPAVVDSGPDAPGAERDAPDAANDAADASTDASWD